MDFHCISPDNISSIYTSGRKCNFQEKGCDAQHLQPININGWFWADGNKRIPPTNIPSRLTFWSRSGEQRKPQPDNYAGLKAGKLGEGFSTIIGAAVISGNKSHAIFSQS